jgi:hypothetical protein
MGILFIFFIDCILTEITEYNYNCGNTNIIIGITTDSKHNSRLNVR